MTIKDCVPCKEDCIYKDASVHAFYFNDFVDTYYCRECVKEIFDRSRNRNEKLSIQYSVSKRSQTISIDGIPQCIFTYFD